MSLKLNKYKDYLYSNLYSIREISKLKVHSGLAWPVYILVDNTALYHIVPNIHTRTRRSQKISLIKMFQNKLLDEYYA